MQRIAITIALATFTTGTAYAQSMSGSSSAAAWDSAAVWDNTVRRMSTQSQPDSRSSRWLRTPRLRYPM
jgi:hypothetical protein